MALTEQDVVRIARLARLQLDPNQLQVARGDLDQILGLIQTLQSVDTAGIAPLPHPLAMVADMPLRLREDRVTETASVERRQALMANAPGSKQGLFLVPKVID